MEMEVERRMLRVGGRFAELVDVGGRKVEVEVGSRSPVFWSRPVDMMDAGSRWVEV